MLLEAGGHCLHASAKWVSQALNIKGNWWLRLTLGMVKVLVNEWGSLGPNPGMLDSARSRWMPVLASREGTDLARKTRV